MYVDPFVMGILTTIFAEIVLIVIYAIVSGSKRGEK